MEKYIAPTVELLKLNKADIITTSGGIDLPEIPITKRNLPIY